ncbi:MAG: MgtC/SapB family protein [Pseudomonadota bacterium]
MNSLEPLQHLALALTIGLLIGTERGWHSRHAHHGQRVAGLRTFGLIALSGGLTGLLAAKLGAAFAALGLMGFAALVVVSYWLDNRAPAPDGHLDRGITTEVAMLATFLLGLCATLGEPLLAAISAVVITALLGFKPILHGWVQKLTPEEITASIKFLLISVVLLPLLPNQGFGPWQAFNPYLTWWMVVLVSGLSFAGYIAIKLLGERQGIMLSSLLGGLVSSTATTLSLAQHARAQRFAPPLLAAGILAASSIMFIRVAIVAGLVNPDLLPKLLPPLLIMCLVHLGGAFWLWRPNRLPADNAMPADGSTLNNPFELGNALKFGLLLSAILVLSIAVREWFGDTGLYILALLSGLADVDALTLSTARMSLDTLAADSARNAILIATFTNTAVKLLLAAMIGGRALGLRVGAVALSAMLLATLSLSL